MLILSQFFIPDWWILPVLHSRPRDVFLLVTRCFGFRVRGLKSFDTNSDRPNLSIIRNQPNRIFGNSLSESSAEVRPNRTRLIPDITTYMNQNLGPRCHLQIMCIIFHPMRIALLYKVEKYLIYLYMYVHIYLGKLKYVYWSNISSVFNLSIKRYM